MGGGGNTFSGNGPNPRSGGRRNSIMELLDQHGDENKQLIDRAGFDALCDELGLKLNGLEKRRAFSSLDAMDHAKDGQVAYSYVRPHSPAPTPARGRAALSSCCGCHLTHSRRCSGPRLG